MKSTHQRGHIGNALAELPNSALLLLWAGMTFGFAIAYWIIGLMAPDQGPTIALTVSPIGQFLDSLYFSIITATSVGYGDIWPQGFSKVLASLQAVASLSTFAILVTKLVSQKQEHLTANVYRLTSEEAAHTILDELHLVRQDIDVLLTKVTQSKELIDPHWHDVDIAITRTQAAFLDIPTLYDQEQSITVSERRENLLLEGVERTLIRIRQFLHATHNANIVLPPRISNDLHRLLIQGKKIMEEWHDIIGEKKQSTLQDIQNLIHHITVEVPRDGARDAPLHRGAMGHPAAAP